MDDTLRAGTRHSRAAPGLADQPHIAWDSWLLARRVWRNSGLSMLIPARLVLRRPALALERSGYRQSSEQQHSLRWGCIQPCLSAAGLGRREGFLDFIS